MKDDEVFYRNKELPSIDSEQNSQIHYFLSQYCLLMAAKLYQMQRIQQFIWEVTGRLNATENWFCEGMF